MNIKRAIGISILAYMASFMVGILNAMIQGIDFSSSTELPNSVWYIGMLISVIIMALFTFWYFKGPKTSPNAKNGFYFGLTAILVGFSFDALVFLPMIFSTGSSSEALAYYTNPFFWSSLLLIWITTTVTGALLGRK